MALLFENPSFIFKLQLFCCFYLTGLIWTVQAVHYPAYNFIDPAKFQSYQYFHTKWITPIVAPVMILELLTAGLLVMYFGKDQKFWLINFIAVLLIWAVTFFLSVPTHNALIKSYDLKSISFLILTNWLRTLLWSFRSISLFILWTTD